MNNQAIVLLSIAAILLIWIGGALFGTATHRYQSQRIEAASSGRVLPSYVLRDLRLAAGGSMIPTAFGIGIIIFVLTYFFPT